MAAWSLRQMLKYFPSGYTYLDLFRPKTETQPGIVANFIPLYTASTQMQNMRYFHLQHSDTMLVMQSYR